LAKEGINVNAKTTDGSTALIWAAEKGHVATVSALLDKKGIDIDAKNNDSNTALMFAAEKGHIDIVQKLLDNGANVNAKNQYGSDALMCAAWKGQLEIVQELLAKGADVNAKDEKGTSALMWADQVFQGNENIAQLLLAKGARISRVGWYNSPAIKNTVEFITCSGRGELSGVQAALAKGAAVNAQKEDGDTALMLAARNNHTEIVDLLKAYGAGRSWMLRGSLILLGAGLVGVGLMFGLGYVLPALSFSMKLTVSIASACTVLLLGYGIDHSVQGEHKVSVRRACDAVSLSVSSGDAYLMTDKKHPKTPQNNNTLCAIS